MGDMRNRYISYREEGKKKIVVLLKILNFFFLISGWFGVRHVQVFLAFYLMFIAYGLRVNLSVGIVAMTDPNASLNKDIPVSIIEFQLLIISICKSYFK